MASPSTFKPHAVAIAFPAQGHIGPLMHLCTKLAAQGFIITFFNTQHNHKRLQHLQPLLLAQGLDIRFVAMTDNRPNGSTSGQDTIVELGKSFFGLRGVFEEMVGRMLQDESPVTLIISDLYLYFTQDVATKLGLRRLAFWTAPAGTLASVMAVKQGFRPPKEPSASNPNKLITWVPGVPPFKETELNTFLQCFDPEDFMYNIFLEPYSRLHETTWIAFNTCDALEYDSIEALRKENGIYTVGPLLPTSYFSGSIDPKYRTAALWEEEYDCLKWLDQQQAAAVLYVSFGSIAILTPKQFEELALGLEASEQPLLWVIRSDLLHGDCAIFPKGYVDRMKDKACFVSWAPQLQVLTHPATGGFLTHCGWNSTMESITAGVPMLGWPYFADQMLNNRCCVDGWKIGLEFEAGEDGMISKEEVERKARALMRGDTAKQLRESAAGWKKVTLTAVEAGGSSSRNWDELVKAMAQPPTVS